MIYILHGFINKNFNVTYHSLRTILDTIHALTAIVNYCHFLSEDIQGSLWKTIV